MAHTTRQVARTLAAASVIALLFASGAAHASVPAATEPTAKMPTAKAPIAKRQPRERAVQVPSIFSGEFAGLADFGWASCATPITWSADFSGLAPAVRSRAEKDISWALSRWADVTSLEFAFNGPEPLALNAEGTQVRPADGSAARGRHIYVAFIGARDSASLEPGTFGLGAPTAVFPQRQEIATADVLIRRSVVTGSTPADPSTLRNLYLHELGHALGLGHASVPDLVMSPVLTGAQSLSRAEVTAIRSFTRPCA